MRGGKVRSAAILRVGLGLLAGGLLAACSEEGAPNPVAPPYDGPPLPWDYAPFPAVVDPEDNPSSEEKVELGRLLFYDPILSGDEATACATCHSELWGLSDGLPVSVGLEGEGPTGPGRDGPNKTTRNAQTIWNVAFKAELFWDGRVSSLEEQALEPLKAEHELAIDPEVAAANVRATPAYRPYFEQAFPGEDEPIHPANIARALAAFERSMVSDFAPYDHYVAGDTGALSEASLKGMALFAEAGCSGCHTPPLFDSDQYAARRPGADIGRMKVTGDEADRGAFRVPTLRNLRETSPYFHDGSVVTLEEAVAIEVANAAANGEGRALNAEEAALVATFVKKALIDKMDEPDRPESVPSGLAVPLDSLQR